MKEPWRSCVGAATAAKQFLPQAGAGAAASVLSHWLGAFAVIVFPSVNDWLKGAHGPAFFGLTLSTAVYFGALGLARQWTPEHRPAWGEIDWRAPAAGFAAAFLIVALPLTVGTRVFTWGEEAGGAESMGWFYLVLFPYALANLAATAAVAYFSSRCFAAAVGAVAGVSLLYLLQVVLRFVFPQWGLPSTAPVSFVPPFSYVLAGTFWAVALAFGEKTAAKLTP